MIQKHLKFIFVTIAVLLLGQQAFGQELDGEYTIGGDAPDYVTINDAVDDLIEFGISGTVTFNIRSDDYEEQLEIPEIEGASELNPIIFQSEDVHRDSVVISFDPLGASDNYVAKLDGVDFIQFKNLSFANYQIDYSTSIRFTDTTESTLFYNVFFDGLYNGWSEADNALIRLHSTAVSTDLHFDACHFDRTAALISGVTIAPITGLIVENSFLNIGKAKGINLTEANNCTIENNVFIHTATEMDAIVLQSASGWVNISYNSLDLEDGSGLKITGHDVDGLDSLYLVNNYFKSANNTGDFGLNLTGINSGFVAHNTFNYALSAGYRFDDCHDFDVFNNVFNVTGWGCVDLEGCTGFDSDYNCYNGEYFKLEGVTIYDFEEFRTALGTDLNSFYHTVLIAGVPNAHTTDDYFLDQSGIDLAELSDDIDLESRDTPPDIGADEFELSPVELALTEVSLSGANYACPGSNPIEVSLLNLGTDAITDIRFKILVNDELYSIVDWVGDFSSGESVLNETIAWIDLEGGLSIDLSVEAIGVNDDIDAHSFNNIYELPDLKVGLTGNIYIGGIYPNYDEVTEAVAALNEFGTCGNVQFIVREGTYDGGGYLDNYRTSSETDTVTFKGETDNNYLYNVNSSDSYTFLVGASKNVIFQDLNFLKDGSAHKIFIIAGSDNILIDNCILNTLEGNNSFGPDFNALIGSEAVVYISASENITISNCEISDGKASIYVKTSANCLFENNLMKDFTICGINCFNSDSIRINHNELITALPPDYIEQLYGVRYENSNNKMEISNNYIKIEHGIAFGALNCTFSENEIWNNAIVNSIAHTITLDTVENANFKFNSIHLMQDEDDADLYDLIDFTAVSNFNCENTIFKNSTPGDFLSELAISSFFDYNDIFLSGGVFSPSHLTLVDWQADGIGLNSFSTAPLFFSDQNLRIQENVTLFGQANGIYFIGTDLESKFRDIPPSLGAYKIGVDSIDLELIEILAPLSCDSLVGLTVNFTNHGPDTLQNAYLFYDINAEVDSFYWEGNLPAGDTVFNLHLSPFTFDAEVAYDIDVWTANENWHIDMDPSNDTASTSVSGPYLKGTFTVGEYDADYLNVLAAVEALKTSGMCGDVTLNLQNGIYPELITFTDIPGLDTTHLTVQAIEGSPDSVVVLSRWTFNKIENITLQNLTFAEDNPVYFWASIEIEDTCANLSFLDNIFGYDDITGYDAIVFAEDGDFTDINIIGNHILNCDRLFIEGDDIGEKRNIVIKDNDFGSITQGGLTLKYCEDLIFENNFNRRTNGGQIMATFNEITGIVKIINNDLGRKGIILHNADGSEEDRILVNNNIIGQIDFDDVTYINFNHNTIANILTSGCPTSTVILDGIVTNFDGYNNIFFVKECDRILDFGSPDMFEEVAAINWDYNVYYANPILPYHDSRIDYEFFDNPTGADWSLEEWIENTGFDENSVWGDPLFISETNLHLNQDNVYPFLSEITPAEVLDDIDYELRDAVSPVIGADEFLPHPNNAKVVGFNVPTVCDSSKNVWALLVNTGTELLTSATLEWEIADESLPAVAWTGSLATYDTTEVYLGVHIEATNHEIMRAWPTLPNGVVDPFTLFDTSRTEITVKFNGHYTVYGDSADFLNLQSAVDSLERYGICDSVFLNIRSGTYEENIDIGYINGSTDTSWVVIQSEDLDSSLVIMNGEPSSGDFQFGMDSTQYLQIRHLTVLRVSLGGVGNISSIGMRYRSSNIMINNNRFLSAYDTGPYTGIIKISGGSVDYRDSEMNNFDILNNRFETDLATCVWSQGQINTEAEIFTTESICIKDNIFTTYNYLDFGEGEEPIVDFGNIKNLEISNNLMKSDRGRAIIGNGYSDTLLITNNSIYNNQFWETIYLEQGLLEVDNQYMKIVNNEFAEYDNSGRSIVIRDATGGLIANNSFRTNSEESDAFILNITSSSTDFKIINNQFIVEDDGICFSSTDSNYFDYNNYFCWGDIGTNGGFALEDIAASQTLLGLDSNSVFGNPEYLNDSTLISTFFVNVDKGANLESVVGDILGNERGVLYDIGAYEIDDFDNNISLLEITAEPNFCYDSLSIFMTFKNSGIVTINDFDIALSGAGVAALSETWSGTLASLEVDSNYFVFTTPILDLPCEYIITLSNPNGETDSYIDDNSLTETYEYVFPVHIVPIEICYGDSILIIDNYEDEDGLYRDTLTSIDGCDSIVGYDLDVNTLITTDVEIGICDSDSILIDGIYEHDAGDYTDALTSIEGCDSILYITLEVFELAAFFDDLDDPLLCIGEESVELNGFPSGGVFSGTGVTGSDFDPAISGEGTFTVYYTYSEDGCSATDSSIIQVVDCLSLNESNIKNMSIHPNPTTGKTTLTFGTALSGDYLLIVRNSAGKIIFQDDQLTGETYLIDLGLFESGMYLLILYERTSKKEVYHEKLILD
ncbi:MAG: hypothetical protein GQ574_15880 [Crocinitomix sp.]|nr:hypothetical protein [Crocinitomix sp.]